MQPRKKVRIPLAFLCAASTMLAAAQEQHVDFHFSPQRHFAAICFPDDWQKSVVTERGGLGYDFGPGPYAVPLTEIWLGVKEGNLTLKRQYFDDPRIPIAISEFSAEGITVRQQSFAIVPSDRHYRPPVIADGKVTRTGGMAGAIAWAWPKGPIDPAFRNVAWGVNRPIKYRVAVTPGSRKLVAMGVCEPYKWGPGTRVLELRIEGAQSVKVDPMISGVKNVPYVFLLHGVDLDRNGELSIEAHAAMDSPDPNAILNAFWVFPENAKVTPEQVLRGEVSAQAELYYDCGPEEEKFGKNFREDAILATFEGRVATPVINLKSSREFQFDSTTGILSTGGEPYIFSRPKAVGFYRQDSHWALQLPSGTTQVELIARHGRESAGSSPKVPDLLVARAVSQKFWEKEAAIPHGKIIVPDTGIQYILDANIRNLYQCRERVDGMLQFQPGPSVYRGLWIHDAVWHITTALMLGDTLSARHAIETLTSFQEPDGQVKIMAPIVMIRETPVFVYIMCTYARVTNDKAWLAAHWGRLVKGLDWLRRKRATTMADPQSPSYGLMPPGFADGGLGGNRTEYSSVYWSLAGLRSAVDAARWLGKTDEAKEWQHFYDDLLTSFRRGAQRDIRREGNGNMYLPMIVADTSTTAPPQRAQWGIFEAQYLGHIFDNHDSLVAGTLAMLDSSAREGLATNTGWLKDGVWTFFAAFHGLAHTWEGNYTKAQSILYAYANHASPLGTWVEEQLPRNVGTKTTGDASNASASALFIMLVRNLVALERDTTLDLLAGVPDQWFRANSSIVLDNAPTRFGNLSLRVNIGKDGRSGSISVSPLRGNGLEGGLVVFLRALRRLGFAAADGRDLPDNLKGSWGKELTVKFARP